MSYTDPPITPAAPGGRPLEQMLARIDAKGNLTITCVTRTSYDPPSQEIPVQVPEKPGPRCRIVAKSRPVLPAWRCAGGIHALLILSSRTISRFARGREQVAQSAGAEERCDLLRAPGIQLMSSFCLKC